MQQQKGENTTKHVRGRTGEKGVHTQEYLFLLDRSAITVPHYCMRSPRFPTHIAQRKRKCTMISTGRYGKKVRQCQTPENNNSSFFHQLNARPSPPPSLSSSVPRGNNSFSLSSSHLLCGREENFFSSKKSATPNFANGEKEAVKFFFFLLSFRDKDFFSPS